VAKLSLRDDGRWGWPPKNATRVLDCVSDLVVAVLYAFAAVESLANHSIDQLDETGVINIEFKKSEPTHVLKADMVRRLNLEEKLTRAVPLLPDGANIKGTRPWERYLHLKRLRDELVHVKERGYSSDPDEPTAYDRLLLGHGDDCVEDALSVVAGARPTFLPGHVVAALAA
jgi:hypothetical protein